MQQYDPAFLFLDICPQKDLDIEYSSQIDSW